MKRKLALALGTIMTLGCVSAYGGNDISILVDGSPIDFTGNQAPVIKDGTTLVPFRAVFEKMDAYVEWDSATELCQATLNGKTVSTSIGSTFVYIDDNLIDETNVPTKISAAVPAQIINGRTMVPLRVLSEGLGLEVNWDNSTRTVSISTKEKQKTGNYTYVMESYESTLKASDGANYIYALANYPQFEGTEDFIPSLNTQIDNTVKKAVDSFIESYKDEALKIYTNPPQHLFEPPYCYGVDCELTSEGNIVNIKINYSEYNYKGDNNSLSEVIKINMTTGEVVD